MTLFFRQVKVPAGAKVIDCRGKTIMPGIIDVHAHVGNFRFGQSTTKRKILMRQILLIVFLGFPLFLFQLHLKKLRTLELEQQRI